MKKLLLFFLAGILISLASCKKNPPSCPAPPKETGFALGPPSSTGTYNTYRLDIAYEEPSPTPGSYFDVKITPEGQSPKIYKAYTDGLPHQLSDNSLGIAPGEFNVPVTAKTFTIILTGKLPPQLQPFCDCGVPSQAYSFANVGK